MTGMAFDIYMQHAYGKIFIKRVLMDRHVRTQNTHMYTVHTADNTRVDMYTKIVFLYDTVQVHCYQIAIKD